MEALIPLLIVINAILLVCVIIMLSSITKTPKDNKFTLKPHNLESTVGRDMEV